MRTSFKRRAAALLLMLLMALFSSVAVAQGDQKPFKKEQLDQMLAPIALYPDALLSQVLMASTYPSDVAQAAAWSKAHPKSQGDDAVKQVASESWDPSVQSLVAFPQVLAQMAAQPDWVQNVGDAFLAQSSDVMDSVQRLRAQAQKAGNLKSTSQQTVVVQQQTPQATVIQIEPADPQVVYVPSYNPTVVYGAWAYPAYPPPVWAAPPGYAYPVATGLAAGLAFGAGVAIANSLWGGFDWNHGDVNINVNRYNNINVNNRISGNGNVGWNHNPQNRRGTPYRDEGSRQRYGQGVGGADQRQAFRGHDNGLDTQRQQAMQSFDRHTNNGSAASARRPGGAAGGGGGEFGQANRGGATGIGGGSRQDMQRQGGFQRGQGGQSSAFNGVQSPGASRAQVQRGEASRQSMGGSHNFGAGRPVSRPSPAARGGRFHR
ncbi:DUF3300 domain-containing protein [Dyella sp. 20L07]|uniref:DUF3300 domain-containing protein n=1 Tax=Dyella sp. 20L07 TaxID=3384240 RepID=UPI003D2761DC